MVKKNIRCLFKKKINFNSNISKLNVKYLVNVLKILFIINLYIDCIYVSDNFLNRFNILKNLWYVYINFFFFLLKDIKINIIKLFNNIMLKFLIKNIIQIRNIEKINYFFNISDLYDIFIKDNYNKDNIKLLAKLIKKKKKKHFLQIKSNLYNKRVYVKNKIKLSLYFFNKYSILNNIVFLNYFIKLFNFKIKYKREFIYYWMRFLQYIVKNAFIQMEYNINFYYTKLLNKYNSLLSFFYISENKLIIKKGLLKNFSFINKSLNYDHYKKSIFTIYYFNCNRRISTYLKDLKKNFNLLYMLIKIKFLIAFKNFIFIMLSKFLIYYLNINIFDMKKKEIFDNIYLNINKEKLLREFIFFRKKRKKMNFSFLKYNYFFFNSIKC